MFMMMMININYLVESEQKNQLDNLLLMYYLTFIEEFPVRIIHTSATTIDNIFIDIALFFLKRFIRQTVYTRCTRMNCKIVPVTNSNRYVQYGASGKGVVEI